MTDDADISYDPRNAEQRRQDAIRKMSKKIVAEMWETESKMADVWVDKLNDS